MSEKRTAEPDKIPVTVLTGFLGAGKTTLLNNILTKNHGLKVAVIENEFGEVGVDDALVKQHYDTNEEIFEMNNGCICCTVRGDLIRILNKILKRKTRLDAVLIETTGLADPAPVAQTFFMDEGIASRARLDGIITLVDAKHVMQHLDEEKPPGVENEAVEQVVFADKILLNKIDLVTPGYKEQVKMRLRGLNQGCEIIECTRADVHLDKVLGIGAFDLQRIVDIDPEFLAQGVRYSNVDDHHGHSGEHGHDHAHAHEDGCVCEGCPQGGGKKHQHDTSVTSVGILKEGTLHLDKLNAWMSTLLKERGADIYRCKGVLSIQGMKEKFVFQGVHMTFNGQPQSTWKQGEVRMNRLVFIGKKLDRKELTDAFEACLIPDV